MKKRILGVLLIAMMAISMVACSDEGKSMAEIKMSKYVKIADFDNLTVDVQLASLEEYEYDDATEELFRNMCEPVGIKGQAVKNGDWVNIDYEGYKGEEQFAGGTASDQLLEIGSNSFIDGFEEGLVGVNAGEKVDLNLTFPENYFNAELAGAEVVFKVTVNYIVPELTDENVAGLDSGLYSNVEEMKAYVRQTLDDAVLANNKETVANAAMSKIHKEAVYKEIPEFMLTQQRANLETKYAPMAADYGIELEQYFKYVQGVELDELAQQYVKERILLMAIAQEIGVKVSEEEYNTGMQELADSYGVSVEELLESNNNDVEYFKEYFYAQKVYDYLYENVTIGPDETEETSSEEISTEEGASE